MGKKKKSEKLVNLREVMPNVKIKRDKSDFGHAIFIDGKQIKTCYEINININAHECNGDFAKVDMKFIAKVEADLKAKIEK